MRKVVFWIHLCCGLTAGLVIFIMSITGAALALQPQILGWIEREVRTVQPPDTAVRLGPEALIQRIRAQRPDAAVTSLTIEHEPTRAAAVVLSRRQGTAAMQATAFVDPYTGALLAEITESPARRFFRTMTDWHRWLALTGERRAAGRWITGVSNAAFLGLALTGVVLWWPRVWTWTAVRAIALFRRGVAGKARDFNWHNVIGVWSATVLVVLTFSGMAISFPKTYELIYAVTGMQRPPAASPPGSTSAGPAPRVADLDRMWAQATAQMPRWRSIALRLPQSAGQPVTFTMTDRDSINRMARSTLTVEADTGVIARWDPYDSAAPAQRLRIWLRFGHTGEVFGVPGQVVAGLASAGGCVLVWTGFALAWRRLTAWRARRRRGRVAPMVEEDLAA